MIKINWNEVEATKTKLFRDGATKDFALVVIILYNSKSECQRENITLKELEQFLFDIGSDQDVKGVFLYDLEMKKPYFKCEEPDRVNVFESVPNSGHSNVLVEFKEMLPEARDVWTEIAIANAQHYISQGV